MIYIYTYIYIYIYIYCREIYTIIYCIWHTRASWDASQVRAQCLPLFLQGGWGGQLGLLGGAAPIVFQLLIRGMSLLVLARIGVRVTRPGRRRICGSIVFGQNALMQGLEGRPLWGRAVYTALHGARLSSVPSGDQSANPASVQGAAVSSERFSQSLPPRNVAELGSSPPLRGSLEQLDRPSPAGPPFQGTELAALSTPEASLKRLVPLVSHLAVWEPLPSVSYWDLPEQTLVPSLP